MTLYRLTPMLLSVLLFFGCSSNHDLDFDKQQAAKARIELGLAYLSQSNPGLAKLNLDKALSYTPNNYLVYSALGYFYQQQGDHVNAEKAYLKAIKLDKNKGDVYNTYGAFLCSRQQFEQAYTQFEKALNTPDYYYQADTYENMVMCAVAQKNTARYRQAFSALEKIAPVRAKKWQNALSATMQYRFLSQLQ